MEHTTILSDRRSVQRTGGWSGSLYVSVSSLVIVIVIVITITNYITTTPRIVNWWLFEGAQPTKRGSNIVLKPRVEGLNEQSLELCGHWLTSPKRSEDQPAESVPAPRIGLMARGKPMFSSTPSISSTPQSTTPSVTPPSPLVAHVVAACKLFLGTTLVIWVNIYPLNDSIWITTAKPRPASMKILTFEVFYYSVYQKPDNRFAQS